MAEDEERKSTSGRPERAGGGQSELAAWLLTWRLGFGFTIYRLLITGAFERHKPGEEYYLVNKELASDY